FLSSETVSLSTANSTQSFKIHKALLGSKSKAILAAFEHPCEEGENGVYKFKETTEGTVTRFIEWAYRGDYPDPVYEAGFIENSEVSTKESAEKDSVISDTDLELTRDDHPLLAHVQLYIFCDIYGIKQLKDLVFSKLTSRLADIGKPERLDAQLAIIDVLRIFFASIHPDNDLADWLAHYAAYCMDKLLLQNDFIDLLQQAPVLGSRMMDYLHPASTPPWNSPRPKNRFPLSVHAFSLGFNTD
ncbi:hypothetical protein BGW36DRAFT_296614, partial [Talaromyces proteolyticus]